FRSVFQLEGGILKYFEECGGAHYDGECFVFDHRTGLDRSLQETQSTYCFNCLTPLNAADRAHEHYIPERSCAYCFRTPAEQMAASIARRHEALKRIISPLPGSQPRDQFKPINVPDACDGGPLIEALCRAVRHIPAGVWEDKCARGMVVDGEHRPVAANKIVRRGERYLHKF